MIIRSTYSLLLLAFFIATACTSSSSNEEEEASMDKQFQLLSPEQTGITFENTLTEGLNTNILMYEYFYNGGGVAVGDLNGDGLEDIYFTGNMVPNKLYLNKGEMVFEDITETAGVAGRPGPWATGVTMADVNGDGLLDIYVCYSGSLPAEKRTNQLFINQGPDENGIPQFEEEAEKYGLASSATSTQAYFFDYDNDGDLDMLLLNHNPKSLPVLDEAITQDIMQKKDPAGPQLFQNNKGKFTEVTEQSGILSAALSYGLGAGIADINGDGFLDIYICNDYTVPDYLYINNGDGTFTDKIQESMGHISHFSMGNDIADFNNDGFPDVFTLDMLPEENARQKLLMAPDNYEKFEFNLKVGFHHQYMRNMLHLNNGNGQFSEIGQLAGVSNTDWSWASLFADFDNDGQKDLFITNGYFRDYTNQDFLKYMSDFVKKYQGLKRENVLELVYQMPSSNVVNYIFKNDGKLTFSNSTKSWGMDQSANSNGAAYADLDNDGDLDLIVNNVGQPAFIYKNNSDSTRHFLKVQLSGENQNPFGVGAKVTIFTEEGLQYLEQMPARGYQSSVSPILHFGLGDQKKIDSLWVEWPSGKVEKKQNLEANQVLLLEEGAAEEGKIVKTKPDPLFQQTQPHIQHSLMPNSINDFKRQPLLVNPLSFSGPVLAKADVNGNGLEDVFVGGEAGSASTLYLQENNGAFREGISEPFALDQTSEDTFAYFFDADGDGDLDLYVGSGGYGNFLPEDPALQDRLYLNDGKGGFEKCEACLPNMPTSTSVVCGEDLNGDGKIDLFVGSRVVPGRYPETPKSHILINQGDGKFLNQTSKWGDPMKDLGLVTDAAFADLDQDGKKELIIVGEWMPIKVMKLEEGRFLDSSEKFFDKSYSGWWNTLLVKDLDGDGIPELLIGNQGLNSQVKASEKEPAEMYYKDFDDNGAIDPILCFYIQGTSYPYLTRDELLDQISMMRTRFGDYASYANAKITDIFSEQELEGAGYKKAEHLSTALFSRVENGKFEPIALPIEAQKAPVFVLYAEDMDGDGVTDILLAGNIERARLRFGKYDANYGVFLKGSGDGKFTYIPQLASGFRLKGDVRSMLSINDQWLFGINQQGITAYTKKKIN
ncbi:VCBS repeat-containing protein [Pleomorphovibrio marinus]|uniref:VCBS repeat-containing protein n=1 Tax=Pleomorphovibrio marinus TaxID=2164132 RepID=UPI000E0C8211|nr:VCBS repeat-containing protein [Pleomorphovibrio marinus]